jgi:hypothetical protein
MNIAHFWDFSFTCYSDSKMGPSQLFYWFLMGIQEAHLFIGGK